MSKIIITGGGAAGSTAAQFARKQDRKAEIMIVEKSGYPQYSKCGLPYALSGVIPEVFGLIEFGEEWFEKAKITLRLDSEVVAVDAASRRVTIRDRKNGSEEEVEYDSLIIATGAEAAMPQIEGARQEDGSVTGGVIPLRTLDDVILAKSLCEGAKSAAVIGAGLIGMETAEALHHMGIPTTIIEYMPNLLPVMLDEDMSRLVDEKVMAAKGLSVLVNHAVTRIRSSGGRVYGVTARNRASGGEKEVLADLVVMATGNRPNVAVAGMAGCETGVTGSIKVNCRSETGVPGVYACGDCTEYGDFVTGLPIPVGMGTVAVRQGRAAGVNSAGGNYEIVAGILSTRVTDVFGVQVAAVGPTVTQLEKAGVTPVAGKFSGSTLPHYFPGGKPLNAKVLVHPETGKILGAQLVGEEQVHQRINGFAAAIQAGMTASEFSKLETAYAPPVAPTLDVITLVCDAAMAKLGRKQSN
ncbi:MAG: NAD(FAD)-dependent dehydrogenase [Thermoplasmata archaeon HGW-Thermoplasmata-1]|nr:MAG: NAD(FAD)-dependent dehydrogenase [Thermoplasmata archaeon HGW-Thermoplasmata-1]